MNLDQAIAEKIFLAAKRSPTLSRLAVLGATKLIWLLAVAILLWAFFTKYGPRPVLTILFSVFFAWVSQLAVAYLIHRRRPFQQNHEKPLMRLIWRTPSFPSGHTTLACAMAAGVFAQNPFWGSVFFLAAGLIAFCRMAVGVHYFSDILAGAVLGIAVATLVSRLVL